MTLPVWLDEPIPFRSAIPADGDPAAGTVGSLRSGFAGEPRPGAQPWALRSASLFDPRTQDLEPDFFARPRAFADLRLSAGPASGAEWEALMALAERLRAFCPDGVIRLEHWYSSEAPVAPQPEWVARLRRLKPLFVHAWVERGGDLTSDVQMAWSRLIDGGIPMSAEILLRRGEAEPVTALRDLCLKLVEWRVRPYVMVAADWLSTEERIGSREALEWVRGLRGWISGLAVPQLVSEGTDGVRTVHIPPYVTSLDKGGADLINFEGRQLRYLNPPGD